MEVRPEVRIQVRLGGGKSVDRPLHQVSDPDAVDADIEPEQVGIEHLGGVVERACRAGEQELVLAPLVLDLDPALLNVDVRRAVLAHGAELDDVAVGGVVHDTPDGVEGRIEVVAQRQASGRLRTHRIGGRRLLGIVHDGFRLHRREDFVHGAGIGAVGDHDPHRLAGAFLKDARPLLQGRRREQRPGIRFHRHGAPQVVVDDRHIMAEAGKHHGRGPAEIAIASQNEDTHETLRF